MNDECIIESLSKKIKKNAELIGTDLREFIACSDGMYFKDKENALELYHIFSWTQSFFTGMTYYAYKITKDECLLKWLYLHYDAYCKKVFDTPMDTMHDLGFLYSLYAVATYKLTGDENMKKLGLRAADVLSQRFIPQCGFIQAWGRMDGSIPKYVGEKLKKDVFFAASKGRVIVDSMMNLPLLFWASEISGHPFYKNIACVHANLVLKHFIRKDNSVCHAFIFDCENGDVIEEANSCGYKNGSHWARGTGWAVYGFAVAYSYTKNEKYLDVSIALCQKFIAECKDEIPIWDFLLPENEEHSIDTSAVCIIMCAILEILKYRDIHCFRDFCSNMEKKLIKYINLSPDIPGILAEQNGRHCYASYGDYFLIEYLYQKYYGIDRIW